MNTTAHEANHTQITALGGYMNQKVKLSCHCKSLEGSATSHDIEGHFPIYNTYLAMGNTSFFFGEQFDDMFYFEKLRITNIFFTVAIYTILIPALW